MLVKLCSKHQPLAEILSYLKIWSSLRKTIHDGSFHFYAFTILENILLCCDIDEYFEIPGMYKRHCYSGIEIRYMCLEMFMLYGENMTPDKKSALKKILLIDRYKNKDHILWLSQGEYNAFGKSRSRTLWRMVTRIVEVELKVVHSNRVILRT